MSYRRFAVFLSVCESVVRILLLLDCRAAWNLSKVQTHTKAFLTFLNISHTHITSLFLVPCGLDSLAVLEVSRMQAALYRLPPAGFNAPRHHAPHAVAARRPPSVPQSTPHGPFLARGHRPTEAAARKRAGEMEGMREKGGRRQTLGEKKRLQVWINHNHLSHESVACVTSQRTTQPCVSPSTAPPLGGITEPSFTRCSEWFLSHS